VRILCIILTGENGLPSVENVGLLQILIISICNRWGDVLGIDVSENIVRKSAAVCTSTTQKT
jgi:hypothetical protein